MPEHRRTTDHDDHADHTVLETPRLRLRPLTTADVELLVELHSDPRVHAFVPAFSYQQALDRLSRCEQEWRSRGHGLCAVELQATGEFAGRAGLQYWEEFAEVEAGWAFRPALWGNGYATEAGRACVEWGFARLGVPYLTAMIDPANSASVRVAERLGFTPRRRTSLFDKDVTVYALDRPR